MSVRHRTQFGQHAGGRFRTGINAMIDEVSRKIDSVATSIGGEIAH